MSDFYSNNNETNNSGDNETNSSTTNGAYSYKKDQINQGESYYQWSPYDDGRKNKKPKKSSGFGAKLGRTAAIAKQVHYVVQSGNAEILSRGGNQTLRSFAKSEERRVFRLAEGMQMVSNP